MQHSEPICFDDPMNIVVNDSSEYGKLLGCAVEPFDRNVSFSMTSGMKLKEREISTAVVRQLQEIRELPSLNLKMDPPRFSSRSMGKVRFLGDMLRFGAKTLLPGISRCRAVHRDSAAKWEGLHEATPELR